jgi:two-component system, OmpR family, KDP operon response regulator KdpE
MNTAGPRILIVDDERPIRRYLHVSLTAAGYTVFEAATGAEAIQSAVSNRPEVIILDLGLPDLSGFEVIEQLREWTDTPILILSIREDERDKVAALDLGADDYLTKPFGNEELLARVRVALRRAAQTNPDHILQAGELQIDLDRRLVFISDTEVSLTPTEYDLLRVLMQNAGKVLTHNQLLRMVWGHEYDSETHLLRVNLSNLRRKVETDPSRPRYILTEPGVGYRLRP